jgi:hypothetical protein
MVDGSYPFVRRGILIHLACKSNQKMGEFGVETASPFW